MEDAGNCGSEQDSRATAFEDGAGASAEDDTLAFIIQVKEEMERCLEAGMSKEEMFRELREKGLHPVVTFAVYKELRGQNQDFFKEYYVKMDLRKQAERLKLLLHQYRTVRDGVAGAIVPGTATQQAAMAVPDEVRLPENGTVPVGLDGGRQSAAGSVQAMQQVPQQLFHHREQPFPAGVFQGVPVPSGACTTSNGAIVVSHPWACNDKVGTTGWHGEQAGPLQQWWPGAGGSVLPPHGTYWQSSVERLPENGRHHAGATPGNSEQAGPSWRPGSQQQSLTDNLRAYENFQAQGEQAPEPLHQSQAGRQPQTSTEFPGEYVNL